MFKIDNNKKIDTKLPIITKHYQVLHFYEMPILFAGNNEFDNQIIGSSVEEDYELETERYFHIIVTFVDFYDFLQGKRTYRFLLEKAAPIFVVDKNTDDDSCVIYQITFKDIPASHLPSEDYFCPQKLLPPSCKYSASLKGLLADKNQADPADIGEIQSSIAKLMEKAFEPKLKPQVLLAAATHGSFVVNYIITLHPEHPDLFINDTHYFTYLNAYIKYCLRDLPGDIGSLVEKKYDHLGGFNTLLDTYYSLYVSIEDSRKNELREILTKNIYQASKTLNSLAENINQRYDQIAMFNHGKDGASPLGTITSEYRSQIEETVNVIHEKVDNYTVDSEPRPYTLYIYNLNTDTGKGRAILKDKAGSNKVQRPTITITGKDPDQSLVLSQYTQSLHEEIYIDILGIAKRENGIVKSIDILYQPKPLEESAVIQTVTSTKPQEKPGKELAEFDLEAPQSSKPRQAKRKIRA